jgi:hypothetical protein
MGNFVNPEPIRLQIGGGDYIDIKKRLNHGETEECTPASRRSSCLVNRRI